MKHSPIFFRVESRVAARIFRRRLSVHVEARHRNEACTGHVNNCQRNGVADESHQRVDHRAAVESNIRSEILHSLARSVFGNQ